MRNIFRNALLAIATLTLVQGARYPASAQEPPSARELYLQALNAMGDLKQPSYIVFRLDGQSAGLTGSLTRTCLPCIHPGKAADHWFLRHRTSDYVTEITDLADGGRYVSSQPLFDPTWYGAFRALRIGMIERVDLYRVPPLPSTPAPLGPASTPATAPDTTLKTIAVVAAIGPRVYSVEDRGSAVCSNGDPGHALHLWSLARNPRHQLSDVIVDLRSMRFCMMRFALNAPGPLGGNGVWEEQFGDVDGYWMETDGFVEDTQRIFGVSAIHGKWRFHLVDMEFPGELPPATFSTPAPVTK